MIEIEKTFKLKIKNPLTVDEEDILTYTTTKYEISHNTISFIDMRNKFYEYPMTLFRGAEEVMGSGSP